MKSRFFNRRTYRNNFSYLQHWKDSALSNKNISRRFQQSDPEFLDSIESITRGIRLFGRSADDRKRRIGAPEYRRILQIPSGISDGALSRPDSFGGVSLAIDNNKGDTIAVTQMRNCLSSDIKRSWNGLVRPRLAEVGDRNLLSAGRE